MSSYYFVGSGIASLAGAAFLIRDGNVPGSDIVIFEEEADFGGALDAHGDSQHGYFMSGSRMFEDEYLCTYGLLSSIPSASDPSISVTEEIDRTKAEITWDNKARLVDRDHRVAEFHTLGFQEVDRIDLLKLMTTPEFLLDGKRISDCFGIDFFETNFWLEWCTLFAFQRWHSAIEFKRYLRRFLHHFSTIDTQAGVYRTRLNQYDAIAVPLVKWLRARGVEIRFGTSVENLSFAADAERTTVESIACTTAGLQTTIAIGKSDCVFVTNGSMTADKRFGSTERGAATAPDGRSGAWNLWHTLAEGRTDFGKPSVFDGHPDESQWESFTVTDSDPAFFRLMQSFSKSDAGRGGLITFKDSAWLLTISIFAQPFFANQAPGTYVWWGYGLHQDRDGDYVEKPMSQCSGREILEEVLGHLGFDDDRDAILKTSHVIPCIMPYITSQFLVRTGTDRPHVVPAGSTNLAFIGQFSEVPDDVVFTVEYSVRSAQIAVYSLLHLDRKPPAMYRGERDPHVLLDALVTLHR